jgi:phage/plasmid-like protein (TIGR03299 family)
MSHELDMSRGEAAIAYRGELPWHGYGNTIEPNDSIETIQKKANLDWTVEASPSMFEVPGAKESDDPVIKRYDNRVILYRSDNFKPLSQVSESNYKVRQPGDILGAFRQIVSSGEFEIEVAGALQGGAKVWALAKRVGGAGTLGADIIKPYLLMLDSYDGSTATTLRATTVRVVCANTVRFSELLDKETQVKSKHSQEFDPDKMMHNLGAYDSAFARFMESMKAMAGVKMTDKKLERFFSRLYAPEALAKVENWQTCGLDFDKISTNAQNVIADLLNLSKDCPGSNLPSANGTLYGALQTVTYYQDHEARTKGGKRWESATIGNGDRMKSDALHLALETIGAA